MDPEVVAIPRLLYIGWRLGSAGMDVSQNAAQTAKLLVISHSLWNWTRGDPLMASEGPKVKTSVETMAYYSDPAHSDAWKSPW